MWVIDSVQCTANWVPSTVCTVYCRKLCTKFVLQIFIVRTVRYSVYNFILLPSSQYVLLVSCTHFHLSSCPSVLLSFCPSVLLSFFFSVRFPVHNFFLKSVQHFVLNLLLFVQHLSSFVLLSVHPSVRFFVRRLPHRWVRTSSPGRPTSPPGSTPWRVPSSGWSTEDSRSPAYCHCTQADSAINQSIRKSIN